MDVDINYWAVLLAGISSLPVGYLWYMPTGWGKAWMPYSKIKPDSSSTPLRQAQKYGSVLIVSLVMAYVLAHVTFLANKFFGNSYLQDALSTAFWLWLGFTAARMYVHDIFEKRPKKLILINLGNELVTALVMALIIGLLKP